jgi:hypothetical protein
MKVIIPLAGPDFVRPNGSTKATIDLDGSSLLRRAIESRSWWLDGHVQASDLVFVLRDDEVSRAFARKFLGYWYGDAKIVFLSSFTRGAALTVLAGCGLVEDMAEPICFDLADIIFDSEIDIAEVFSDPTVGGVALSFSSQRPIYSYIRRDEKGEVVETAEKRIISEEASAGVYFFRSVPVYLAALAHVMVNEAKYTYGDIFYICPILNGVLREGLRVSSLPVTNVFDIKT